MRDRYSTLYTLALLSFFIPAIHIGTVIRAGYYVRWAFLLALTLATLVAQVRSHRDHPQAVYLGLSTFLLYCLATAFWSENPPLTVAKWSAFVLVAIAFFVGGLLVGEHQAGTNPFAPLAPVLWLALLASAVGAVMPDRGVTREGFFEGLIDNPNMLGSMLAFIAPYLCMEVYLAWERPKRRFPTLLLAATGSALILLTRSRAALLMALCIVAASFMAVRPRGRIGTVTALILAAVFLYTMYPAALRYIRRDFIYKQQASGQEDLFFSRRAVIRLTYEKARAAGWWGVGFGISTGQSSEWNGEISSIGFGREKGNSQLAVWEETGIVGLAMYGILMFILLMHILSHWPTPRAETDVRLVRYVLLGLLVGAFASSMFEAWFTAPGSGEVAAYWATLGLGYRAMKTSAAGAYARTS